MYSIISTGRVPKTKGGYGKPLKKGKGKGKKK